MNSSQTQSFIDQWHRIFAENDPDLFLPLMDENIEFFSPAIFAPKYGKSQVSDVLRVVFHVFENYRIIDTWIKDNDIMFEFEAEVGKFTLQGIDRFRLNEDGKVAQMKVWIRPLTGLKELARAVTKRGMDQHLADQGILQKAAVRTQVRASTLINSIKEGLK